jgi:PTS system glucose-specific IIC component
VPAQLVAALGGARNIANLDACITRLRVELHDLQRARPAELRRLGATGVMQVGNGLQAVFGTRSENLKTDIEEYLARAGAPAETHTGVEPDAWRAALGGADNITDIEVAALTRLRVQVIDAARIDEAALERAGARGLMRVNNRLVHVIVGPTAAALAAALER